MSRIIRSAMLQMRVSPEIKFASEHVLRRIGLNLTEATELFLRRMIVDQSIPFDVVAIDTAAFTKLTLDWQEQERREAEKRVRNARKTLRQTTRSKGG
jgi:addiction module RelB/DinJ family antitoxin